MGHAKEVELPIIAHQLCITQLDDAEPQFYRRNSEEDVLAQARKEYEDDPEGFGDRYHLWHLTVDSSGLIQKFPISEDELGTYDDDEDATEE